MVLEAELQAAGAQRRASAIARLDRRAARLTADDIEAEQVSMLVALIAGWRLYSLAGEPLDVYANGTLIAHGEVVVINEKFGIRLTDVVSPAERIRKLK